MTVFFSWITYLLEKNHRVSQKEAFAKNKNTEVSVFLMSYQKKWFLLNEFIIKHHHWQDVTQVSLKLSEAGLKSVFIFLLDTFPNQDEYI